MSYVGFPFRRLACLALLVLLYLPSSARAEDILCDPGDQSCRDILINYIRNEQEGIDVAFWFMEDTRYTIELINKWKAGVPVRVLVDTRANAKYELNAVRIGELEAAGIPIRRASSSIVLHWKMMLFSGQKVVQFSGANYSADAWRPTTTTPYENYTDEIIYFSDDGSIVNSFRTKYDDHWVSTTRFTNYANVNGPLVRSYDIFTQDAELNFGPSQGYRSKAIARYNAENEGIDVMMYRLTVQPHADALIAAVQRGVPVRLIVEPDTYRDIEQLWHSWNVDRLYMAGVQIKKRAHAGKNHQKSVLLHQQGMVIFGSSNWTPWDESQYQHDMFTTRPHIYDWAVTQFERKWNNTGGVIENVDFVPLPPDEPKTPLPAHTATAVATTPTLSWLGGPWAHKYDVYLGTTPTPPRVAQDLALGPSDPATKRQQYAITTPLITGTTYYWRVVGKTVANKEKSSPVWSFTTEGVAPPPEPPPVNGQLGQGDILLYASKATRSGNWVVAADGTAAGAGAMWQPETGAAKINSALANPANYFEMTFNATAGVPYRLWVRSQSQNDKYFADSVFIQFSGSVNQNGTPQWRIGTTSGTEHNLEECSGCGLLGWGWEDNGWGGVDVMGPLVYFATGGSQTIRVQQREDGIRIDQIMLSPSTFLNTRPGQAKTDSTVYPESGGGTPPPPPPSVTVVRQPYLQQVTSTSAIIVWTTLQPGPASVRLMQTGQATRTIAATSQLFATTTTGAAANYYQHVARIQSLSGATSYQYDILVDGVDANPGVDTFKTAPSTSSSTVRFIAFGDSGTGSTQQQQVNARIKADTFDFALHAGDVAYGVSSGTGDGTYQTLENWFFGIYKDWLRSRPMFPSMGNHDVRASNQNGQHYLDAFVLPEDGGDGAFPDHAERYYSFDYGPVHVVVLDTELAFQNTTRRAAQLDWLQQDLSTTNKPWKVALFHRSPYSAGGEHGSDLTVRAAFGPIFEEHDVQLVISAHEHDYERTKPQAGVTYIVAGGGGAPLYPAGTASFTAASASRHHYVRGTASQCTLRIDAIGTDGSMFDTVTLDQCGAAVDTQPPAVVLSSPSDGATVSGNVPVSFSATDNVGVVAAQLFVDGVQRLEDTVAPFSFTWNSTSVSNSSHTLQVRARDAAGNVGSSSEIAVQVNNASAPSTGDIVLYAKDASVIAGTWRLEQDSAAAGGSVVRQPNANLARIDPALATPTHYIELTFQVQANTPYHLWVRAKSQNESWANDSVHVQFTGTNTFRIGTTSSTMVNLEDCSGCGTSGWGWQDNGYGVGVMGPNITFTTSGTQTIRLQTREDGMYIDQIVLSPQTYLTSSPGQLKNDNTILPPSGGNLPPPDTTDPTAAISSPADDATVGGTVTVSVNASDNVGVTRVDLLVDGVVIGTDTAAPFSFSWNTSGTSQGTHTLQARAQDAAGNTGTSASISVTVDNSSPPPSGDIVLYAADASHVAGAWKLEQDPAAAGGWVIRHPNANLARIDPPLASPTHYIEFTFQAEANVPYRLWIRAKSQNESWANDSVHVQFSAATSYKIGTTSATMVNLEDCSGCGTSNWGWQDNGYGVNVFGPTIFFTSSGTQTIRLQTREDGMYIDQIVLSPQKYLNTSPGTLKNDTTIVSK